MWYSATTFWFNQIKLHAPIAQLVEQLPFKEKVPGSNPGGRTSEMKWNDYAHRAQGFCEAIAEQKAVARFEARLSWVRNEAKRIELIQPIGVLNVLAFEPWWAHPGKTKSNYFYI